MSISTNANPRTSLSSWTKTLLAAASAIGVAGVCIVAPLSVPQASAEVTPLARGEVMNQELMAEASADSDFTLPSVTVDEIPVRKKEPVPEEEPADDSAEEEAPSGAPASGTPDPGSAQAIAQKYVGSGAEFDCLVALWDRESGWNVYAENPGSGAYGIPQALPGNKMADAGSDWQTNADTQIRWGLGYIQGRYGSPCAAWGHSESNGWY
ncbi:MAG: lytic transglycosylase domain-containing protein [Canibacter sp.]